MNYVIHKLPSFMPIGGLTIGRHIFLKHPHDPNYHYMLQHEIVHAEQYRHYGFFAFLWHYIFSREWRANLEAEAYATNILNGQSLDACARALSGALYLWPCSYQEARIKILSNYEYLLDSTPSKSPSP